MKSKIIFQNKILSDDYINDNILQLIKKFRNEKIINGDIVICKSDSNLGILFQWLACIETGVIPLFVPIDFTNDKIKESIKGIKLKAVIETRKCNQHIFSQINDCGEKFELKDIPSGSVIHTTSATTGNPKLVLRTKQQFSDLTDRYIKYLKINESDVILSTVPFHHSWGFGCGMLLALEVGATLVIPDIILPRNIIQACNIHKTTMLLGVPILYKKMVNVSEKYRINHRIKYILSSGASMEKGLQENFFKRFGMPLFQEYGCTETGCLSISESDDEYNCVGKPLDGVSFEIREDNEDRPWIYISSPKTLGAYINESGINKFNDDFIRIGDIGSIGEDGKLKIFGRGDDVLIIAGKKISKKKVIEVIRKIKQIKWVDIFIKENEFQSEIICKYSCDTEINSEDIRKQCKKYLPDYQIPRYYIKETKTIKENQRSWKNSFK